MTPTVQGVWEACAVILAWVIGSRLGGTTDGLWAAVIVYWLTETLLQWIEDRRR